MTLLTSFRDYDVIKFWSRSVTGAKNKLIVNFDQNIHKSINIRKFLVMIKKYILLKIIKMRNFCFQIKQHKIYSIFSIR